ncbi:MAG: preprotein translocase subunit SecG [Lachnospirales bacterium]
MEMSTTVLVLVSLYIVFCIGLVVLILLQKKRSSGINGLANMGSSGDTYWDKNKSRTFEGRLEFYTKIGIAVLFIFTFVISLL